MKIKKQMKKLFTAFLCLSLCGCNSFLGPKTEYETFSSEKLYDSQSGQMQTGKAVEWNKEKELDPKLFGNDKKAGVNFTDNTKLWDAPGLQAFYMPDYHSLRSGDIIDFELIRYDQKNQTVVYAYETLYYGTGDGLDHQTREGYAVSEHYNWPGDEPRRLNVPGNSKKENTKGTSSQKTEETAPKTDKEVICLMEYNMNTGAYKIHDLQVRTAPTSISYNTGDGGTSALFTTKSMYATYLRDPNHRYGTNGIYVLCIGTHVKFFDEKWLVCEDWELSGSLISADFIKMAQKAKKSVNDMWYTSITNFVTDGNGNFYVSVYMKSLAESQDDPTEDPTAEQKDYRLTRVINFINTSQTKYISENTSLDAQIEAWENSTKSEEEIKEEIPDKYTIFYPEGMKPSEDRMTGIGLCANHWSSNMQRILDKDSIGRTYFRANTGMYWEKVYRADMDQDEKDRIWSDIMENQAKSDHFLQSWMTKLFSQPFEVTGNNLNALMGDQNDIVYYLYDPSKNADGVMMWKEPRNTKIESYVTETETVTRVVDTGSDSDSDSDSGSGSDSGSDAGSDSGSGGDGSSENEEIETEANFNKTTTITMKPVASDAKVQTTDTTAISWIYIQNPCGGIMRYSESSLGKVIIVYDTGDTSVGLLNKIQMIDDAGHSLYAVAPEGSNDGFQGVFLGEKKIWMFGRDPAQGDLKVASSSNQGVKLWAVPYEKILIPDTLASKEDSSVTSDTLVTDNLLNNTINGDTFYGTYGIQRDERGFRFTSLTSGIVLYTPPESEKAEAGTTMVIDDGQYYASWKNQDGSYTAIGFQGDNPTATYADFVKAKVYNIKVDRIAAVLNTLQSAMNTDHTLRERFLASPQSVCSEFGIQDVNDPKVTALIQKVTEAKEGFDSVQRDFWNWATTITVTQQQKDEIAKKLLLCSTTEELKALLVNTYMETVMHEKDQEYSTDETTAAADETKSSSEYRNELLEQVKKSQAEQKQKDAVLEGIIKRAGCLSERQLKVKLQEMLRKIQFRRSVWPD